LKDINQLCKGQRVCSKTTNHLKERIFWSQQRLKSVITVKSSDTLADSARNLTKMRRKQLQWHNTAFLVKLPVTMTCAEYTWVIKMNLNNTHRWKKKIQKEHLARSSQFLTNKIRSKKSILKKLKKWSTQKLTQSHEHSVRTIPS